MSPVLITVDVEVVHEALLLTDTLRPGDRGLLRAIFADVRDHSDGGGWPALIREYYRDGDRADRTPRQLLYMHLGFLVARCAP